MRTWPDRRRRPESTRRVLLRLACALTLALAGTTLVMPTPARAAGSITLDKTSSSSVLVGGTVQYGLAATNPAASGVEQYNLSFTDVLPPGVRYVAGSTSPSSFGEPQVITITDDASVDPPLTHQVLVWSNVADLTPGATRTLSFSALVDAITYPIGSTVANSASAFTSSDPREQPEFDSRGNLVGGVDVVSATDTVTTPVTAIRIRKGEGSPEGELLRGVNDHQTVYSLTVTNNNVDATAGLVVVDYLPAGLEFLGCGGAFHSAAPEYPGASNTVATVTGCTAPDSVETVQDPVGHPAGVYTRVTWHIGTLAQGGTRTLRYAAGVPQRANTMTWPAGAPDADTGEQGANLDNNTGPSTRETADEQVLRNEATVAGDFQGAPVADATSHAVTAEDLRLVKSVRPTSFVQGQLATYTLSIDTSEYVDLAALSIVDTIPAGLCPIDDATNWTALAECAAQSGHGPTNARITGVVTNPDGSFTMTLVPDETALDHNGHLEITYQALMRATYDVTPAASGPTSADDTFTNHAEISGTSTVRPDVDSPDNGTVGVTDESSATITSDEPVLTKLLMPNATPMQCSSDPGDYAATAAGSAFTEGDRVCFLLQVQFPHGVDTRNAQLTDFLPTNLSVESWRELGAGGMVASTSPTTPTQYITWNLGTGSPRAVPKGTLVQLAVSALVTTPAPADLTSPTTLERENLAKFRFTNTAGQSDSLRASVRVPMGPPPPIGVTKGVRAVNGVGLDTGMVPGNVDDVVIRAGDLVTFRVDLQNLSRPGGADEDAILAPLVWDVLPAGITCAAISAISDGGACYDAGAPGRPHLASGDSTSSVLAWQLPAAASLDPQEYRSLTYDMAIPPDVSVSTVFVNTASVVSYETSTNIDDAGTTPRATHHPEDNVSADVDPATEDVPPAHDSSDLVRTPDAAVTKLGITDITETGNAAGQAVVGETLTYTVGVRVPARTSVYNARLVDPLPAGVVFVGPASAGYSATGSSPASSPLPAGVTLDPATGALLFGTSYANTSDSEQLFEVRIPARIGTDAGNVHGTVLTNTATFTSDTAATGGTAIPPRNDSSSVTVVAPQPALTKSVNPSSVTGGTTVTYTVRAANTAGRPPLHDTWVVDCLPSALSFGAFSTVPSGTSAAAPVAGDGTNGCAAGYTRIAWNIADLAGGANIALVYTATVNTVPAGGDQYANTATLTGSTLEDGKTDPTAPDNPLERVLTASATATVSVGGASISKSAGQTSLTIGQTGTFTIRVTIPRNTAFYDSAVVDTIPSGMSYVVGSSTTTCAYADATGCAVAGTELAPSGNTVGWLVGDLAPATQARTVTIVYSARMNDVAGNAAGATRTNTVRYLWNRVNGTDPGSVGAGWAANTANASASVRVVEPLLTIGKAVDDATVEPGQVFEYTVTVTNNGRATNNASPAYNYTVTDTVPAGVVVDPATLVGGTLSGTDANGSGGTITWGPFAGPLAVNASATFRYAASLAPSGTLTAAGRTNTARVTHYESLPSGGRTSYAVISGSVTVTPQFPHITPTKSAAPGPAYLGRPKAWTITLTNDGGAAARHVGAVDTLPRNWTYDAGSATVTVAGSTTPVEPVLGTDAGGSQVLTWADLGTAPASGADRTIVIAFTATPTDPDAATDPGVGATVAHTNSVSTSAQDATGATANASASYAGGPATGSTHIDSADVRVTKTSGDAVAGANLDYTIVVRNDGPDTAVGPFPVVDDLPPGLGAVSWTGSGWACSLAASTLSCARSNPADTLATGASFAPIRVSIAVPADAVAGTGVANTATVGSTTFDPDLTNNTSVVTDTIERQSDLGIVKTTSGPVVAGARATYTLDVTNHGPSDASGPIGIADTLPSGTAFVSATGTGWNCAAAGGTLTCTRTDGLAGGQSAGQITVAIDVPADRTGTLRNTATVDGPEPDPNPDNDTATVTDPVVTSADLAITKSHRGAFVPGAQATYELEVTNNGPSDAAAPVRVTDQLAPELTFVSDDSAAWDCSADAANLLTCTLGGPLPLGQTRAFAVTVAIDPAHTGDIENTARVSSPTDDPHPGNNTDGDTTGVTVEADLAIAKSHTGDATAGSDLDFRLVVTNNGASGSPGPVTVTDTIPDGMSYVSASGTDWACHAVGQAVTCTRSDGLAAGASAPAITLRVAVAADVGPTLLTNHASVTGTALDPDPSNNTATDDVTVVDRANVRVAKSGPTTADAGSVVSWILTVTNDGPSDADAVQLSDALPPGTTFVGVTADSGVICADTDPIDCAVSSLAAGASRDVRVRARIGAGVADGTVITNTATVSTATPGDDPDDNVARSTLTVTTSADLELEKSHAGGPVVAGEQVTFDLAVHNHGPSDAVADVVVTDTLPAGMAYVGSTGTEWSCAAAPSGPAGQVVTCTLRGGAPIITGADAPALALTAQVGADVDPDTLVDGSLVNAAEVTSGTEDPDPDNNHDTDTVPVTTNADLSITKTHAGPVRIGDSLDFTLQVANAGPSVARQVVVVDDLPAALEYVAAGGPGWTCSAAGQVLTCTLDAPLAAGDRAAPIVVTVTVLAAGYPLVSNSAVVDATTTDPVQENNTGTDEVVVPPQVDLGITKSHSPEPMQVGEAATYTLGVSNAGNTDDPGPITITDALPDGLTFVRGDGDGWTCAAAGQDVTCIRAAGLATTGNTSVDLVVQVGPQAYPGVTNTATVASLAEDTNPVNNTAQDPATVLPRYELVVAKDLDSIGSGRADWAISVTNNGPNESPAGAVVVDDLPRALRFDGWTGDGWTCAASGRLVTCTYTDPIPAGQTVGFVLHTTIDPDASGTIRNSATVEGGNTDTATGRIPTATEDLATTGGFAAGAAVLGLVAVALGTGLLRARRRQT